MKNTIMRNGVYYSNLTNPFNGKRIRKSLGKDQAEAKKALDVLIAAYTITKNNRSGVLMSAGCGWEVAYESFYETHISDYDVRWRDQLSLILDKLNDSNNISNVADYEFRHVQTFINRLKKELKPATVNKYVFTIRKFFEYCIKMGWIKENPCRFIERLDESSSDAYHFTDGDLTTLFDNANGYTDWWTFLLETGIRACDAKSFTQSNFIVQDRMYVQFKQHKHGKKAKSIKLPVTKKVVKIVENAGDTIFPECHKWLNRKGYSGHYNGFMKQSQKLMRELLGGKKNPNMMRIEHHTFRHTFAINRLNAGMPKEVLQTLLGHSSLTTTEAHYANWMSNDSLDKWVD